jgi:hypothetical protein
VFLEEVNVFAAHDVSPSECTHHAPRDESDRKITIAATNCLPLKMASLPD